MSTPLPPAGAGAGAIYDPSQVAHRPQPRTSPIAHFASLPNDGVGNDKLLPPPHHSQGSVRGKDASPMTSGPPGSKGVPTAGRLLAANARYVAYAVKNGLVRVIDRRSAAKTLLRGHREGTRMVDASFFGEAGAREGVAGLWDALAAERAEKGGGGANGGSARAGHGGGTDAPLPPAAASDVLATLGGAGDRASVLVWRLRSSPHPPDGNGGLGADKLLEVRFGAAGRLAWHPFNPNRFLLLHRNWGGADGGEGAAFEGGRTVATLVETTRLVTRPHEAEAHMVCDCEEREGGVPGMVPLKVASEDATDGAAGLATAGANDVAWSSRDARHVLTGHDDGMVRLWDLTVTGPAGVGPEAVGGEPSSASVRCVSQLGVTSAASKDRSVTRVLFLSQYEDSSPRALTPPFLTGTDMNHTIALWSSFSASPGAPGSVRLPQRLRVFGIASDGPPPSLGSMLSVELIPAPYRPEPPPSSEVAAPSSFVLLAERTAGTMHALHLDTAWKGADPDDGGAPSSGAVVVGGFDYVTTLNVVHPVYSYAVAPTSGDETADYGDTLKEERDVELCCIQSKAVQMLALSAGMLARPENGGTGTAPGVTLLEPPAAEVSDDNEMEEGEEKGEEEEGDEDEFADKEFEEDYDMEDDGLLVGAEYPAEDSVHNDDAQPEIDTSLTAKNEPNDFSNWLGAIANPLPPPAEPAPAALSTKTPTATPPPGLGFASILPPPPGMAPAPAAPTANNNPMNFLSPMQILSGSGSDLDNNQKGLQAKSISPKRSSVQAPASAPPPGVPAVANKAAAAKRNTSKKRGQDAGMSPKRPPVAAGPTKILQRAGEPPKDEANSAGAPVPPPRPGPSPSATPAATGGAVPAADPSAVEAAVRNAIAAHAKSHEAALLASVRKAIASEVSSKVGLAVGNAVRAGFKDVDGRDRQADARQGKAVEQAARQGAAAGTAEALTGGIEEGVERGLAKALERGGLAEALEARAREGAERAAREAVAGMQPAIMDSLHQTMREVMIPAYESATRQMFQQTSTTLEQGLAQMALTQANNAASASSSMAPTLQTMATQMMKMGEAIHALTAEVTQLRGAIHDTGAVGQNDGAQKPGAAGLPRPVGVRDEVAALCRSGRYEEAFTKAVSASDGDLVLFACKNADVGVVFGSIGEGAVTISQPILICLMQQLGAVLLSAKDAGDVRVILNWLQEIAVTIDPANVNIQRHVGSVVQQLMANINSKMSNCDPAFRRPLQMLMQVIRGLL